jgi:glutamine---fructose-6-phosphate transaminase (isomerizing)
MSTEMLKFIVEQPKALKRLLAAGVNADELAATFGERKIRKIWIVGSGTSLYAAMIAARSWERELGIDCEAVSSLEFLDETETGGLGADVMALAISQSGASLILLEGVRRANAAGAITAAVTADAKAPISLEADFVIETHTGAETALGKTKGFTTTAFAAILLGRRLAMGAAPEASAALQSRYARLPAAFEAAIEASRAVAGVWADRFRQADALFVVGAGSQVPTALEGALKVLEVAKMPVISKELEEMMHGPFNGVGPATGIVLAADEIAQSQRLSAFVKGVKLIGTPFATLAAGQAVADRHGPFDLVLPPCEDEAARAVLGVVPFQLLAHDLAAARGAPIDTARYPELYPVFQSKSIHR